MNQGSLLFWDMFTRETLQNSWDARLRDGNGISFSLDLCSYGERQQRFLNEMVFGNEYSGISVLDGLVNGSNTLEAVMVSDTGTRGLSGPVDASQSGGSHRHFVSFVRNIGRNADKEIGGGTYGFGKAVFFKASSTSTILVYSRTTDASGNRVNRFIAIANADTQEENSDGDIAYTGRHWWGERGEYQRTQQSGVYALPFEGDAADLRAHELGMDRYFTETRETGTTVLLLGPRNFESDDPIDSMADALTRWAWPHMINQEYEELLPIDFSVSRLVFKEDGGHSCSEVVIPKPENDPVLSLMVDCYKTAVTNVLSADKARRLDLANSPQREFDDPYHACLMAQRPIVPIGALAFLPMDRPVEAAVETDRAGKTIIRTDISSHIALIRGPRMVVDYYRGPANKQGSPYCGVFITVPAAEEVFARSEPPEHNKWEAGNLSEYTDEIRNFWKKSAESEKRQFNADTNRLNNPVSIAFNQLRRMLSGETDSDSTSGDNKYRQAVSKMSSRLGRMLGCVGTGTDTRISSDSSGSKRSATSRRRGGPEIKISSRLTGRQGSTITRVATVKIKGPHRGWRLSVIPSLYIEGKNLDAEKAQESGLQTPLVTSISVQDGKAEPPAVSELEKGWLLPASDLTLEITTEQSADSTIRFVTHVERKTD